MPEIPQLDLPETEDHLPIEEQPLRGLKYVQELKNMTPLDLSFPSCVTILTELSELQLLAMKQISALALQGLIEETKALSLPDSSTKQNIPDTNSNKPKAILWWQRVIGKKEKPTYQNRPRKARGGTV